MVLGIIIKIILFYLLLRFVFNFIIPIYRTTKSMSDKVREMNERLKQQENSNARQQAPKTVTREGDYIDYEEVK